MGESSADLQRKQEKEKKEERKFRKKNQFRFGLLVQPWEVDVLAMNWSAQSQDLCWGDTSSSDQREELELQKLGHDSVYQPRMTEKQKNIFSKKIA